MVAALCSSGQLSDLTGHSALHSLSYHGATNSLAFVQGSGVLNIYSMELLERDAASMQARAGVTALCRSHSASSDSTAGCRAELRWSQLQWMRCRQLLVWDLRKRSSNSALASLSSLGGSASPQQHPLLATTDLNSPIAAAAASLQPGCWADGQSQAAPQAAGGGGSQGSGADPVRSLAVDASVE
ncbi:hypothetical protein HaLaN_21763 [Haematococcus lacustris]|uniref:Uncharacterized protein n=1 Tax=Haematococcus lacustris TaxID=44745 RepID=A0A699ZMI4_HAELA|nr:hypothetical protein HaLaN_21763 [Haematococcus lacustris]